MKISQYIITRAWILFIVVVIGILLIFLQINRFGRDEYIGVEIGDGGSVNTNVGIHDNISYGRRLTPFINTAAGQCEEHYTDLVRIKRRVTWTPSTETDLNVTGTLNINKVYSYLLRGTNVVANSNTDARLLDWVGYRIVGASEISLNGYVDVVIEVFLNDPGNNTDRRIMQDMMQGTRLFINFDFRVNL
jgi:hypothetical protein